MDNPYIKAQKEWDERFAFHAEQARRWYIITLVMAGITVASISFGIWAAVKTEYVPYIVAVDKLGRTQAVLSPKTIKEWPTNVIKRELADFVTLWRSVPSDIIVMENNLRRMFYYMEQGDPADTKIKERSKNPQTSHYAIRTTKTIEIDVSSVNFVGGNSWLIEWVELTRQRNSGSVLQSAQYQGTFVLKKAQKLSPEILTKNPLGVLIEDQGYAVHTRAY